MRRPLVLLPLALMAWSVWMSAESARIEIVLDVSGSMRSSLGSQVKIDAAKSAIRQTVAGLPMAAWWLALLRTPGGAGA